MTPLRRSVTLSLADGVLGAGLQFGASIAVARLVAPADIGVFTVASLIMALAGRVRDFGIGEYLVQAADDTPSRRSAALWLNLLVSWSVAAIACAASEPIAEAYRDPRVGEAIRWMSLSLLIVPFGAVCLAAAQRRLDTRPMVAASLLSNTVHALVAVGAALAGWGFMSLVAASVAGVAVSVAVALAARPRDLDFTPEPGRWPGHWPAMAGFGVQVASLSALTQAGRSVNELAIGRLAGLEPTAWFSRAAGLVELFGTIASRALSPITLAAYAADARADEPASRRFLRVQAMLTGAGWPFLAVLGVLAEPVIALLYGPVWAPAAPLVGWLCLAACLELAVCSWQDLLVSRGEVARANRTQALAQLLRLPGLLLIVPLGLTGAALGAMLASGLAAALVLHTLRHATGLAGGSLRVALAPSLRTALVCAVLALPAWLLARTYPETPLLALAVAAPMVVAGWLHALRRFDHPLWPELTAAAARLRRRPVAAESAP
jgi:O-antigen/teichoic acid export membrane protein